MNERKEFEKQFPVPDDTYWDEKKQGYYRCDYQKVAHPFNDAWEGWQEALRYSRTQSGQGAEADEVYLPFGAASAYADAKEAGKDNMTISCELVVELIDEIYRLNAHPQPAQQGSVPEGWRECLQEMVQAMHDYEMSVEEDAPYKHRAMMDRAHALLSATPQPPKSKEGQL